MTPEQLSTAKALQAEYESLEPNAGSTRNHQARIEIQALILLFELVAAEADAT